MGGPEQSSGTALQAWLCDYLYAETLHSIGSYNPACQRLTALEKEISASGGGLDGRILGSLTEGIRASTRCNENLRDRLHRLPDIDSSGHRASRRPSPFSDTQEEDGGVQFEPNTDLLDEVAQYYRDSLVALQLHRDDPGAGRDPEATGARLGARLAFIHDPQRRGRRGTPEDESLVEGKIGRTKARLWEIDALRRAGADDDSPSELATGGNSDMRERWSIQLEDQGRPGGLLLPPLIDAFSEAHMWMHKAENVLAHGFGETFTEIPDKHAEAARMLRYATALNTFVFVTARAAAWIFAEDDVERRVVIDDYVNCCDRLAPTYCMWIAAQFSLLSLHRRAFAFWTRGEHDAAYRDYHKLTRLLRGLRGPTQKRGLRVPGTRTFIEGMTASSELHIGRIYRGQHAYRIALRYFKRARRHTKGWESDSEIGPLIRTSHWRINLLLNEGKASFELGNHKRSILQYARAWAAYLLLVQSETHARANVEVVKEFIRWLEPIVDDPDISRTELGDQIEPLIEQMVTLRSPVHLRLLAADIIMRMGHLVFILRLPHHPSKEAFNGSGPQRRYQLALECIEQALRLDPTSTLATTDLSNIIDAREELEELDRLRRGEEAGGRHEPDQFDRAQSEMHPLKHQWPSGGGAFEDAARITELTLQRWLAETARQADPQLADPAADRRAQMIARGLLRSFLTHTDSSNMKLAQVYAYLMRPRKPKPKLSDNQHMLDFVCLRRYSSFFPFLPRPAAFRASGGGYFVQIHEPTGKDSSFGIAISSFGIAIDPGPDFIENLYACGYSIADVDMIVLTHDHADHIASVDALLALMGIHRELGDPRFDQEKNRCLAIVGNESVRRRYAYFGKPHPVRREKDSREHMARGDAVRVLGFGEIARITRLDGAERLRAITDAEILLKPEWLRIEPVKTWGHTDANGYPSQGFMLRSGPPEQESTILFTGDTGSTEQEELRTGSLANPDLLAKSGRRRLLAAVDEADVVVAHISAVPLKELRELSNLDSGAASTPAVQEYRDLWAEAAAQVERKSEDRDVSEGIERTRFLLSQVQFGFRSRPEGRGDNFGISPFSDIDELRKQPERHLYLTGLIEIAERMARPRDNPRLLLVGELREELGTFRTQVARRVREAFFTDGTVPDPCVSALTTDIGLRVRLYGPTVDSPAKTKVLCSTCDLDNDLQDGERYHAPAEILELCVKGEDEGVFYNCSLHDPRRQEGNFWVESVERYNVFGE